MNTEWSIPSEEKSPNIRLIDGKTLYTIVSGNDSFFSYIVTKYYYYITNYYKSTIKLDKEISELVNKAYNMNLNIDENKMSGQILEEKKIVTSSNMNLNIDKNKSSEQILEEKKIVACSSVKVDEKNIYSVELFAGCGGLALGLEMAGFENKLLCEIDKNCVKTLSKNRPNWNIINKDITHVDFTHLKYKVAIVSGGFPCQSWSQAGKREGFNDERGNLFFQFKRAINEIKPPFFIGENVQGLATHDGGKTIKLVKEHLESIGYIVKTPIVLNSNDFDVAQKRKRLILLGIRKDLKYWYKYLKYPNNLKNKKLVLKDVLKDVPESKGAKYSEEKENIFKLVPPGGCWIDIPIDIQKKYMKKSFTSGGGKRGILRRISWDEPCLTLLTSPSQKQTERCHPDEERPFTTRECARIQSFPDEWEFEGSINKIYKQIGNAVPPNLAYYVGKQIFVLLTKMISKKVFIEDYKTKEI
jgi:DNA (cytosine-5)-methyltransferase 1